MIRMANGSMDSGGISPTEMQKIEQIKKTILRNILTKEARERLNRIKLVKPELAMQLELYLVQMYQNGKLRGQMTDRRHSIQDGLEVGHREIGLDEFEGSVLHGRPEVLLLVRTWVVVYERIHPAHGLPVRQQTLDDV